MYSCIHLLISEPEKYWNWEKGLTTVLSTLQICSERRLWECFCCKNNLLSFDFHNFFSIWFRFHLHFWTLEVSQEIVLNFSTCALLPAAFIREKKKKKRKRKKKRKEKKKSAVMPNPFSANCKESKVPFLSFCSKSRKATFSTYTLRQTCILRTITKWSQVLNSKTFFTKTEVLGKNALNDSAGFTNFENFSRAYEEVKHYQLPVWEWIQRARSPQRGPAS